MKTTINIVLLLLIEASSLYAQTVITGTVKNRKGEPMQTTVTLQRLGANAISGFTSTDNGGKYSLTYRGTDDSLIITVRGLTVEKTMRRIPNRSATIDFRVVEKVNKLKEVRVTASPVRRMGDTLSYTVGQFSGQSDRTIEDVMKKMPGIEVTSSGTILYNSKPISKFYIENLDLLEGRYNMATRNIEADDVAAVQVYENHQPVKVESMLFSDQTAINLKLKDSAKGIWTANALVGIGYKPVLWNAELTAMHFAYNRQHISIYKGNNSGHTSEEELMKHYDAGAVLPNTGSMLSVSQPSTPNVAKKRYTDNRTNSVSINQLIKIRDKELTANINYYNERLDKEGYSSSTQYLPDGNLPLIVEESVENVSKENNLDVSLRILSNEKTTYLRNNLDIKTSWSQTYTNALSWSNKQADDNNIYQHLNRPYFSIVNSLDMRKRINNHLFRIRFTAAYNDRPHRLRITPAYYFSADSLENLNQELEQRNLNVTLRTSYGLIAGDFSLNYTPRINVNLRNLNTELTGTDREGIFVPAADSLRNELWFNTYQIGMDQEYTYRKGTRTKVRLLIPTYYLLLSDNNRLSSHTSHYNRWIVNPSLSASYNFTPSFSTSLKGFYRKSYGNMNDVYTGYILQSYRNLLRNTAGDLFESSASGGRLSLEYRDAIRMLFFNVGGRYQHSWKNLLYGYNYNGIMGVKTTISQPTQADTYNLYAGISKTFRFWQTKIGVSGGGGGSKSELLLQDQVQPYRTEFFLAGASLNTTPCRYLNLSYNFSWMQNKQWIETEEERYVMCTHSHTGQVWIFPTEALSINFNVDYQHYNTSGSHNMAFADAMVRYRHKQIEWELECNNLFNAKRYVSTIYSGMNTSINRYELRPLSFLLKIRFKLK